jgi:hypothetical protein
MIVNDTSRGIRKTTISGAPNYDICHSDDTGGVICAPRVSRPKNFKFEFWRETTLVEQMAKAYQEFVHDKVNKK